MEMSDLMGVRNQISSENITFIMDCKICSSKSKTSFNEQDLEINYNIKNMISCYIVLRLQKIKYENYNS